ncbi:hypothetical protein E8E11_000182 [Didymella keratinophila]|nr:hypothetical protein E8E11_000182 [Didymella keratinophila]
MVFSRFARRTTQLNYALAIPDETPHYATFILRQDEVGAEQPWKEIYRHRKYFGLTQTCQTLCSKYLPLYKENVEFNISVECVLRFVIEYLQAPETVDEHVAGTFKIAPSSLKKVVDLRPLILLL